MKLVFCGTPKFAVGSLEAVIEAGHEVVLVVTQPDRAAGRGMETQVGAVKAAAVARGLEVVQPEKIKNNVELRERLERIAPDAILVVAYGRIIPDWMLALRGMGCINLHGSLLPKYRGAAPIQWAVANGEMLTGGDDDAAGGGARYGAYAAGAGGADCAGGDGGGSVRESGGGGGSADGADAGGAGGGRD